MLKKVDNPTPKYMRPSDAPPSLVLAGKHGSTEIYDTKGAVTFVIVKAFSLLKWVVIVYFPGKYAALPLIEKVASIFG